MPFMIKKKKVGKDSREDRRNRRDSRSSPSSRSPTLYNKFRSGTRCRFCREKMEVEYKDVYLLSKLCTPQLRIMARKKNGNCLKHQKRVQQAIKYARFLALLPYEGQR